MTSEEQIRRSIDLRWIMSDCIRLDEWAARFVTAKPRAPVWLVPLHPSLRRELSKDISRSTRFSFPAA